MMRLLDGKTALVTGASRGIGRAIAARLAASGALVAVHYATNQAAAEDCLGAIEAVGGQAFLIQSEFGTPGALDKLVRELESGLVQRAGEAGLDILVNNAGGGGSVINISSEAARINLVETVAYGMAKSALEHFTRCLAKEIGPRDIRVNSVAPGIIHTAQSDDYLSIPARRHEIEQATPLRRVGHVSDMAEMVHALVTTAGAFTTGQLIEVSGGYLL